jgi:hypothetical protein
MADHGIIAVAGTASMDIPISTPHGAELRTEIGAEGIKNGISESQASGLITDEGGKYIATVKVSSDRDAQGFLSSTEEDAAFDHSRSIEAG